MSYPDPKYTGTQGEASAVLRRAGQPFDLEMGHGGTQVHYLATGARTKGEFGLYGPRLRCDAGRVVPDAAAIRAAALSRRGVGRHGEHADQMRTLRPAEPGAARRGRGAALRQVP